MEEEKEEEEEEEEEEGLQEFTLCLACLRFMPHSLTSLYRGAAWGWEGVGGIGAGRWGGTGAALSIIKAINSP